MPVSHVIVWAGNYGSNTYFHGEVSVEDAANKFQAKPIEHQTGGFFTQMPAFQVLNQFSKNGYSVLGMSGNGACQTSWVIGKSE